MELWDRSLIPAPYPMSLCLLLIPYLMQDVMLSICSYLVLLPVFGALTHLTTLETWFYWLSPFINDFLSYPVVISPRLYICLSLSYSNQTFSWFDLNCPEAPGQFQFLTFSLKSSTGKNKSNFSQDFWLLYSTKILSSSQGHQWSPIYLILSVLFHPYLSRPLCCISYC